MGIEVDSHMIKASEWFFLSFSFPGFFSSHGTGSVRVSRCEEKRRVFSPDRRSPGHLDTELGESC